MKQNEENSKDKSNKKDGNKENLEMLLDNNSETYQIMKNQRPKNIAGGKKALINYEENKDSEDIVIPKKTLKRSNSIKLYKKHKKEKEEHNINNDSTKNTKNNENLFKGPANETKKNKGDTVKKVTFLEPNFLTIIDVESYKKFNAENTCKDPFEDMDFLNNINNVNNYNINININKKNNAEDNGKERVNCSCSCSVF